MKKIIIGTRGSRLALAQAGEVKTELEKFYPQFQFEIKKIKTTSDLKSDLSYKEFDSEDIFTKQIDEKLLNKKIDLAVHSMKDVPTELPDGVVTSAVTERRNSGDVLVSKQGLKLEQLPRGARIGTSSVRRRAQLLRVRPDLKIVGIRGNLDTRIKKLDDENIDAIVVAMAGLERLNYKDLQFQPLSFEIMLPAVGQGCLAIQTRADDVQMREMVSCLNHEESYSAVEAERAVLKALGGGCRIPVGVWARVQHGNILLKGIVLTPDGKRFLCQQIQGRKRNTEKLINGLTRNLITRGAKEMLG